MFRIGVYEFLSLLDLDFTWFYCSVLLEVAIRCIGWINMINVDSCWNLWDRYGINAIYLTAFVAFSFPEWLLIQVILGFALLPAESMLFIGNQWLFHEGSMLYTWPGSGRQNKPYPPIIKCDNGSPHFCGASNGKIMENPPLRLRNLWIAMFDHQLWFPWEKRDSHVAKEQLPEPSLLPSSPGRSSTQGAVENILLLCILCGWLCIKMYAYNIICQ